MKKLLLLPMLFYFCLLSAQIELEGSWKLIEKDGEVVNDREVIKIIQDNYFALGSKEIGSNKFLGAAGGEFSVEGETLTEIRDFDTYDKSEIGVTHEYNIIWQNDDKIEISDGLEIKIWERVSPKHDELTRTWVITGRERDGKMNTMMPGDRRTVKILSGNRFQWIAFNSGSKEFMGTGGGTYTTEDGKYTENIEFFSRDNSRVGASLEFEYEVKDGQWHHKGKSSKGDNIYEIWSPLEEAYQKK